MPNSVNQVNTAQAVTPFSLFSPYAYAYACACALPCLALPCPHLAQSPSLPFVG